MPSSATPLLAGALVLATLLTLHALPQLTSVLLLVFAGIIFAVLLDAVISALERILPGGRSVAYAAMLLGLVLLFAVLATLIGPRMASEVPRLVDQLPTAWERLSAELRDYPMLAPMLDKAQQPLQWLGADIRIVSLVSNTFGGVFNILVVVFVGIYAAASPQRYLHLGRHVLSPDQTERIGRIAGDLGHALRLWLLGRSVSMTIVGLATGAGLFLLDIPLAFTLGLWAGMVSFVPYIGPVIGLIPALLIAALDSVAMSGWVLLLYTGIQTIESTLLTPLIQQRVIALPPVILIAIQLIGGVLMGSLGVLLAAPLVLTGVVALKGWRAGV